MKPLLLFGLLFALPVTGMSESVYSERVYRGSPSSVQRVTTVRTTTYPSVEVYRDWDTGRDYLWNDRRYHWDGTAWVVAPTVVYSSRGAGFGASPVLQDDVGLDHRPVADPAIRTYTRVEQPVRTYTRVEVDAGLAIDVQRRLARRGYYRGPIDGIVGPGTRSAIAAFQDDHGFVPNGIVTQQVVNSLGL